MKGFYVDPFLPLRSAKLRIRAAQECSKDAFGCPEVASECPDVSSISSSSLIYSDLFLFIILAKVFYKKH